MTNNPIQCRKEPGHACPQDLSRIQINRGYSRTNIHYELESGCTADGTHGARLAARL